MTYTIEPLSPKLSFGKTVRGLTKSHLDDPAVHRELRGLWVRDGMVVFRDGEINEDFQLSLSKIFGPLEAHPVKEIQTEGKPDLITLRSEPDSATIVDVDGDVGGGFLGWHKDLVYVQHINHGGILRALTPSKVGGITGFIDQIDAWERLPADLRTRIENLHVVYQMGPFSAQRYMTRASVRIISTAPMIQRALDRIPRDFPPVSHPLVFQQPETGRKALNLSPFFAQYIEELGDDGHELLLTLAHHIIDGPAYHHQWTTDEMILWDNWRMLHSVTPTPVEEDRVMQRTTIKGDYGLGRTLSVPVAAE